jgi:hypothetical protein
VPNPAPDREYRIRVEFPPGKTIRASAAETGPQRMTFSHGQIGEMVQAAVATGRIGPGRAGHWRERLMAGGRTGGDAIAALLSMPPTVIQAGGASSDDDLLALLWPTPAQAAEAAEARDTGRPWLKGISGGYVPGPQMRMPDPAASASLTDDEVFRRLYGDG